MNLSRLVAAVSLSICCLAAQAQSMTLKGQWQLTTENEQANYVTVQNQRAFVATEKYLKIIDVSNPTNPTLLRQVLLEPGSGFGLFLGKPLVAGNIVFVTGSSGLAQVDIADLDAPKITRVALNAAQTGMTLSGNRLYVPVEGNIEVLEVFGPSGPVSLGRADTGGAYAQDIKVADGLAYVASRQGLRIIDVTNPQAAWLVGSLPTGDSSKISLIGDRAYMMSYTNGVTAFQVIDVSSPVTPTAIYASNIPPAPVQNHSLAMSSTTAFLGLGYGLFARAYNLANPDQPAPLGEVTITAVDLDVVGNYCYAAAWRSGLVIYNIQNPAQPIREGTFHTFSELAGVVESSGYAYLRDPYNGTHIVDVRDPAQPARVATYVATEGARSLLYVGPTFVSGNRAYISTWTGFDIVDVSNPAAPARLGSYRGSGATTPIVVVSGNYAYTSALEVIDVSNPASPVKVGSIPIAGKPAMMTLQGNYIYYAFSVMDPDSRYELGVIDITNPAAPRKRGTLGAGGALYFAEMAAAHPVLFLGGYSTLQAIDVSNPDSIQVAYNRPFADGNYPDVAVSGSNLFQGGPKLLLTDISDPYNPVDGPSTNLTLQTHTTVDLAASGNFAYLSLGSVAGSVLQIYEGQMGPAPVQPRLSTLLQNGNLIVRWSTNFSGLKLYSTPRLGDPWQLVTSNVPVAGDSYSFTNTRPIGAALFYKLAN